MKSITLRGKQLIIKGLRQLKQTRWGGKLLYLMQAPYELAYGDKRFLPNKFIAVRINDAYWLGVDDIEKYPLWKQIATSDFEIREYAILQKLLKYHKVFLDVGAHIGYYTCLAGTYKNIQTLAFEPNPDNFSMLRKNVKVNDIKNISLYKVALSDNKGKSLLFGVDGAGSIKVETFKNLPKVKRKVMVDMLDKYIQKIPDNLPIIMKIDVEGNEYNVLKGGLKVIKNKLVNVIFTEVVKYWGGGQNPHFNNTFSLLDSLNYLPYKLKNNKENKLTQVNDIQKARGGSYFFIRKNIIDKIGHDMIDSH